MEQRNGLVHCSVRRRRRRRRKKNIFAVWRLSCSVLSRCFLAAPQGVLFVMKTLEDER